jgi:hypothetical protein
MIIFRFGIGGSSGPLWRARIWASEHVISFNGGSEDIRWAIIALALHWLAAAWLYGQRRFLLLGRKCAGRDGEAGRFCGWNCRC